MSILCGFILLLLLSSIQSLEGAVTSEELYPFGPESGDSQLAPNDDSFDQVFFRTGEVFYFFNSSYSSLFINNNGGVSFGRGNPIRMGYYYICKLLRLQTIKLLKLLNIAFWIILRNFYIHSKLW